MEHKHMPLPYWYSKHIHTEYVLCLLAVAAKRLTCVYTCTENKPSDLKLMKAYTTISCLNDMCPMRVCERFAVQRPDVL